MNYSLTTNHLKLLADKAVEAFLNGKSVMKFKTPRVSILWPSDFPVVRMHKQTSTEIEWKIPVAKLLMWMYNNEYVGFTWKDLRREMQTIERQWDRDIGEKLGLDNPSRKEYNG